MDNGAVLIELLRSAIGVSRSHSIETSPDDWKDLLQSCARHRVSALAFHGARQQEPATLPAEILDTLRERAIANALRTLKLSAETEALALALAERHIPMMLLKGMHLATAVYPSAGMREMVDVDVMVREQDVAAVLAVLTDRGYRSQRSFSLDVDMKVAHHATALARDGCAIEVHWALADPSWNIQIPTADVWKRTREVSLGRARVSGLCDEDLLVHLSYHAVIGHDFTMGLRPLADIAALLRLRRSALDWSLVRSIATQPHVAHAVSLMLALTQQLFGVEVPRGAITAKCPDEVLDTASVVVARGMAPERLLVNVARVREGRALSERLKWIASRFLVSRAVLAKQYGVSDSSPSIPLLYVKRAWHLLTRYGTVMAQSSRAGDPAWQDADQRALVRRWVVGASRASNSP